MEEGREVVVRGGPEWDIVLGGVEGRGVVSVKVGRMFGFEFEGEFEREFEFDLVWVKFGRKFIFGIFGRDFDLEFERDLELECELAVEETGEAVGVE